MPECETMSFVARACNGNVTFIRDVRAYFALVRGNAVPCDIACSLSVPRMVNSAYKDPLKAEYIIVISKDKWSYQETY